MAGTVVEALILDLLEWLAKGEKSYEEVMEAWRTSCPKLPVWEDANDRGLVTTEESNGRREDYSARARPAGPAPGCGGSRSCDGASAKFGLNPIPVLRRAFFQGIRLLGFFGLTNRVHVGEVLGTASRQLRGHQVSAGNEVGLDSTRRIDPIFDTTLPC